MLASALLAREQASDYDGTGPQSGCHAIDSMIGVLQYGSVCCISAEANSGGRDLGEAYIASHLLSSPDTAATVIDTAISFDVRRFYRMLVSRLEDQTDAQQQAMQLLERIKIMKVFDFEGLTDSITEYKDTLDGKQALSNSPTEKRAAPRGTIGDSEDEDEMLDSPSPPPNIQANLVPEGTSDHKVPKNLLFINSISQVAAPLIKNRHVEGQALLTSFMRSLNHLTTTHRLCTILLNDTIPKTNYKEEPPSAFAACAVRPALGRSFEHMLDTHLLVHRSLTRNSEELVGDLVSVVEVLQDRNGSSLGQWSAFMVDDSGSIKDVS